MGNGFSDSITSARRKPMRRWLGIEISAYGLLVTVAVTQAWHNGYASWAVAAGLWVATAGVLSLWFWRRVSSQGVSASKGR
jgi:hypothetical protein